MLCMQHATNHVPSQADVMESCRLGYSPTFPFYILQLFLVTVIWFCEEAFISLISNGKDASATVKVVIFARVIFRTSAICDFFACFYICIFQPSYIDLHTKFHAFLISGWLRSARKSAKINVAPKFPLLQYIKLLWSNFAGAFISLVLNNNVFCWYWML